MLTLLFLLFCAYLCKDRLDWAVLLICGAFLLACSSSGSKSADASRCLDAGNVDTAGAVDQPPADRGGLDGSPNGLAEALGADCTPLDSGSLATVETEQKDARQALDMGKDAPVGVDAGKTLDTSARVDATPDTSAGVDLQELDSGGPCASGQILVNGTCQPCGGPGQLCCPGNLCGAFTACMGSQCMKCGDLGGLCCPGNLCSVGTCKTGVCNNA